MDKEEALRYLKRLGINEKHAAQAYDLVGGRMIHLMLIADSIRAQSKAKDPIQGMWTACYVENRVSF